MPQWGEKINLDGDEGYDHEKGCADLGDVMMIIMIVSRRRRRGKKVMMMLRKVVVVVVMMMMAMRKVMKIMWM